MTAFGGRLSARRLSSLDPSGAGFVCVGSAGQLGVIGRDVMVPVQSSGTAPITSLFSGDPYGIGQLLDSRAVAPNVPLVNSAADAESPPASCRCPAPCPLLWAHSYGMRRRVRGSRVSSDSRYAKPSYGADFLPTILGFASALLDAGAWQINFEPGAPG